MNLTENELDMLFEQARTETPVASFEDTQKVFVASTVAVAGGVLASKSLLHILSLKKWIVMLSLLTITTTGVLISASISDPAPQKSSDAKADHTPAIATSHTESDPLPDKQNVFVATVSDDTTKSDSSFVFAFDWPELNFANVIAYDLGNGAYKFVYHLTPQTSRENLEKMKKDAEEAGMTCEYDATFEEGQLKRIALTLSQKDTDGSNFNASSSTITFEDDEAYVIAWNTDDDGKATSFYSGRQDAMIDFNFPEMAALQQQIELELPRIQQQLDSAIQHLDNFSFNAEAFEQLHFELAEHEREIEQSMQLFTDEHLQELLEKQQAMCDEVNAQLSAVQEQIEAQQLVVEAELAEELRHLEQEQAELEQHVRNQKNAHKKLKQELINDGLIDTHKSKLKVKAKNQKITVNGKEIPEKLYPKYTELLRDLLRVDITNKETEWSWSSYDTEQKD